MVPVPDPGKLALFLDFDGTLVNIAPRPQDVVVYPALLAILRSLDKRLDGALALVSGRKIADLDLYLDPLRLRCAGVHGAEQRFSVGGPVERSDDDAIALEIVVQLQRLADSLPGVMIENKHFATALHYRANPAAGPKLGELVARFLEDEPSLSMMHGHCIYEIKKRTHTKGTAIEAFMTMPPFAGRTPTFIGDDVTDRFGFDVVKAMGGLAYSVGREMEDVDDWFSTPQEVRGWLEGIIGKVPVEL